MMRSLATIALLLLTAGLPVLAERDSSTGYVLPGTDATRRVAITFDDLPAAQRSFAPKQLSDPKEFEKRNAKFLGRLRKLGVPVGGFVSPLFRPTGWSDEDVSNLIGAWESSGATLGNHTSIHRDFHEMRVEDYLASIRDGQEFLERVAPDLRGRQKYFRAPYLHRGKTEADRKRLEAFLIAEGYQAAPVTIDLQDWVFAEIYADADAKGDKSKKADTVKAYMNYLGAAIEHYALLSYVVLGREAPHVALLHASALNYDNIDEVIRQFEAHDFVFVDLKTVLRDPAYGHLPDASGSWIRGWQLEAGLPWTQPPTPRSFLPPRGRP